MKGLFYPAFYSGIVGRCSVQGSTVWTNAWNTNPLYSNMISIGKWAQGLPTGYTCLIKVQGGAGMAQWWERSLAINVTGFDSSRDPYVGWVCCWLLWRFFSKYSRFPPSTKTNILNSNLIWNPRAENWTFSRDVALAKITLHGLTHERKSKFFWFQR